MSSTSEIKIKLLRCQVSLSTIHSIIAKEESSFKDQFGNMVKRYRNKLGQFEGGSPQKSKAEQLVERIGRQAIDYRVRDRLSGEDRIKRYNDRSPWVDATGTRDSKGNMSYEGGVHENSSVEKLQENIEKVRKGLDQISKAREELSAISKDGIKKHRDFLGAFADFTVGVGKIVGATFSELGDSIAAGIAADDPIENIHKTLDNAKKTLLGEVNSSWAEDDEDNLAERYNKKSDEILDSINKFDNALFKKGFWDASKYDGKSAKDEVGYATTKKAVKDSIIEAKKRFNALDAEKALLVKQVNPGVGGRIRQDAAALPEKGANAAKAIPGLISDAIDELKTRIDEKHKAIRKIKQAKKKERNRKELADDVDSLKDYPSAIAEDITKTKDDLLKAIKLRLPNRAKEKQQRESANSAISLAQKHIKTYESLVQDVLSKGI